MEYPKVSIVILNFNTKQLLEKLVPFALQTNYPNFEVVVADNASSDDSAALVRQKFPQVKLIEIHENLGFAGGYNFALEKLDTEYWVLLNSDVEVDADWLTPMMNKCLSDPKVGCVQPKIKDYYHRDKFEYAGASGGFIDVFGYPFCRGRVFQELEEDKGQYNDALEVFWASGAALLVRAELYKKLGGLDADFFAHMEEIDLCWRVKNAGYTVWCSPESTVYHMGGGTLDSQSPRKTYLNFRNNLALILKNTTRWEGFKMIVVRLILDGVAGIVFLKNGKWKMTMAVVKAHWSFFGKLLYWSKKRSKNVLPLRSHQGVGRYSIVYKHFIQKANKFSDL